MFKLKVRRENAGARIPEISRPGDAAFDLYADHDAMVRSGTVMLVGTGVSLEIPDGYVGLVCPRSGLALIEGVTVANAPGVIDSNFRGELKVMLTRVRDGFYHVHKGDRIAQLVITAVSTPRLEIADELSETNRGAAGFGSSGR